MAAPDPVENIPAVFERGVFRPTVPVNLPEGTKVRIVAPSATSTSSGTALQNPRQRFLDLVGSVDSGMALGTNNEDIDRDLARQYGESG